MKLYVTLIFVIISSRIAAIEISANHTKDDTIIFLQNEPATLFDLGLLKMQARLNETKIETFEKSVVEFSFFYNSENNKISISANEFLIREFPFLAVKSQRDIKKAQIFCQSIIEKIKKNFGYDPRFDSMDSPYFLAHQTIGNLFTHANDKSLSVHIGQQIAEIVTIEAKVVAKTQEVKCKGTFQ
jgi:hypothetical protein